MTPGPVDDGGVGRLPTGAVPPGPEVSVVVEPSCGPVVVDVPGFLPVVDVDGGSVDVVVSGGGSVVVDVGQSVVVVVGGRVVVVVSDRAVVVVVGRSVVVVVSGRRVVVVV